MHATLQSLASDALAVTQRLASRRGFGCRRGLEPGMQFSMRDSCRHALRTTPARVVSVRDRLKVDSAWTNGAKV